MEVRLSAEQVTSAFFDNLFGEQFGISREQVSNGEI